MSSRRQTSCERRVGHVCLIASAVFLLNALPTYVQADASTLSESQVVQRLTEIEGVLQREARPARLWWAGWLAYGVVEGAVGGVEYGLARTRLDRDLWLVTWVGSALLVGELLVFPMLPAYAARKLARLPRNSAAERRRALTEAERLLARSAQLEREGVSVWNHLLGAAWAAGTTAYVVGRNLRSHEPLGARHNRAVLRDAGIELVWTLAVTELAIWTQPLASARAASRLLSSAARPALGLRLAPAGLGLKLTF